MGGEGDYIPIATLNDSCIKMGTDESYFNVSLTDCEVQRQSHN